MNVKRVILFLTMTLFLSPLWAAPKELTVVFLAEPVKSSRLVPFSHPVLYDVQLAGHDFSDGYLPENCIPREGGCFHPQYGFIPHEEGEEKKEVYVPTFGDRTMNAGEMDLVDCEDEKNHFNLYCGRSSEKTAAPLSGERYQVWFDISTSMRRVDYSRDPNFCNRRLFAEKLVRDCTEKPGMSIFNTSLVPISNFAATCRLEGTNNTQRIIDWIGRSNVEHLVVITDVDEINPKLMNFLDAQGARTFGAGDERIFSSQLTEKLGKILPPCQGPS